MSGESPLLGYYDNKRHWASSRVFLFRPIIVEIFYRLKFASWSELDIMNVICAVPPIRPGCLFWPRNWKCSGTNIEKTLQTRKLEVFRYKYWENSLDKEIDKEIKTGKRIIGCPKEIGKIVKQALIKIKIKLQNVINFRNKSTKHMYIRNSK